MPRQYKTLSQLRGDMRAMLGNAAAGAASGVNQALIDLHLQNAQTVLYWAHDWAHLRRYETKPLGVDQYLIDYPAAANPDRITAISVLRGSVWSDPIPKGIPPSFYTTQDNKSWPQRWEPYTQIEVWPKADQIYSLRIFYIAAMGAFAVSGDRATIDDTLISIVAIATLKAHYRQPDSKTYEARSEALLVKLKGKSWGKSVFRPGEYEEAPMAKPQTV